MTPEQRTRLTELLPAMRTNARRLHPMNAMNKAMNQIYALEDVLRGCVSHYTAEEWLAIAEKAAQTETKGD